MLIFESSWIGVRDRRPAVVHGFTLTELLVVTTIVLMLTSLLGAAVAASQTSHRRYRTLALISKLDGIITAQYTGYASRNVDVASNQSRGQALWAIAGADLPDTWDRVESLANDARDEQKRAAMSPHQRAYVSIWNSTENTTVIKQANSSAECLFMIVMQGGIADCLDCRMPRIEIGDEDGDGMPEFIDAWGKPICYVLKPTGLRLPAGSAVPFFTATEPFDSAVPSLGAAKGGLMRPLIYSTGPDRIAGISVADASPLPGATEHADNLTNFEEEAKR